VELGLVEQRYQAVREVLDDGANVTGVARRYGVARQTVHSWLHRYVNSGLAGLADRSCCPHQMAPAVETRWWSSGGPIPAGAHGGSSTSSAGAAWGSPPTVGVRTIRMVAY
jgi:Homeodomain-like domain